MTEIDERFARRAIGRKRLFLGLSIGGLAVAGFLTVLYTVLRIKRPDYPIGPRAVIVLLILLNARQNLRQYKFARLLEELMPQGPR
jgi:hypothetical protein